MTTDGSEYDAFARDYAALYPDTDKTIAGERNLPLWQDALDAVGPGGRILDSACGTGTDLVALLRHGYDVTGADASAGMLKEARRVLERCRLDARLIQCSWEDLPSCVSERFDVVLCWGNAICHARSGDHMIASLQGMADVLKTGGRLFVSSRSWERMLEEAKTVESFAPRTHLGVRTFILYVWHLSGLGSAGYLNLILLMDHGETVEHRSYRINFVPFRRDELLLRMDRAGLKVVRTGELRQGERYYVEAIKEGD
jgi:SAM-dependent methyltransferase